MVIADESHALSHLRYISYYRLKGYWWDMQQDPINHIFKANSCFHTVIERYHFDKELRHILFDAIETIEIALRTQMIYHLSQAYGGLWYLHPELFTNADYYQENIRDLKKEFLRSREIFAQDYRRKYTHLNRQGEVVFDEQPDAWIVLEVATFGTLSKMYKNLLDQMPAKAKIANGMGLNKHNELSSWLEAISYLRNIVAHHSRLWNRNMVKRPLQLARPNHPWLLGTLSIQQQKRPFYIISAMLYLCNVIAPQNKFKERLLALFTAYPNVDLRAMGFPENWREFPLWK